MCMCVRVFPCKMLSFYMYRLTKLGHNGIDEQLAFIGYVNLEHNLYIFEWLIFSVETTTKYLRLLSRDCTS